MAWEIFDGGADEIRTHDLCSAIAALSQLSYSPIQCGVYVFARATVNWPAPGDTSGKQLVFSVSKPGKLRSELNNATPGHCGFSMN